MLVGITGKKGVGKDTVAGILSKKYGLKHLAFADPIREVGKVLGFTDHEMCVDKEAYNEIWRVSWRMFAQQFGTDFMREKMYRLGWIKLMNAKIEKYKNVVISDVRFDNEAEEIKEKGGIILRIDDGIESDDKHQSEKGIKDEYVDVTIFNKKENINQLKADVLIAMEVLNG